jgi:cob(I)alamin adenosyltransferase
MGNRLSKIVTRTGDGGETGLADGSRIAKHADRIHAIGTVDELNSFTGTLLAELSADNRLKQYFSQIQNDLFDLGGELAMSSKSERVDLIKDEHNQRLDDWLEELNAPLEPLKNFIMPGGSRLLAACHVVRSVTRRAERDLSQLAGTEQVNPKSQIYLNRLSDLAFVAARWLAKECGEPEVLWDQKKG